MTKESQLPVPVAYASQAPSGAAVSPARERYDASGVIGLALYRHSQQSAVSRSTPSGVRYEDLQEFVMKLGVPEDTFRTAAGDYSAGRLTLDERVAVGLFETQARTGKWGDVAEVVTDDGIMVLNPARHPLASTLETIAADRGYLMRDLNEKSVASLSPFADSVALLRPQRKNGKRYFLRRPDVVAEVYWSGKVELPACYGFDERYATKTPKKVEATPDAPVVMVYGLNNQAAAASIAKRLAEESGVAPKLVLASERPVKARSKIRDMISRFFSEALAEDE